MEAAAAPTMAIELSALLDGVGCQHLANTLANEQLSTWEGLSRLALLQHLKEAGVARLVERQALANAYAKAKRGEKPEWKVPPPPSPTGLDGSDSNRMPDTARSDTSPPYGTPIFDSNNDSGFTAMPHEPPDEAARALLQQLVLDDNADYHESRMGGVRLKLPVPALDSWTTRFGECGDRGCGCCRMREPRVRRRFRNLVVERTLAQLANTADQTGGGIRFVTPCTVSPGAAIRYATVGCGDLLTDVEILLGLSAGGATIEHICVCDSEYRGAGKHSLFRALRGVFAPARVVPFSSIAAMTHAAKQNPDDHGHMTLLAHIDANNIPSGEVHGLASRILVPGGHLFKLSNDGQFKAGRECWRRGRAPPPANMNDVSDVSDWRLGLERVTLGESAGRTNPLGVRESDDSWKRPLYDGEENEYQRKAPIGKPSDWQVQQATKGAAVTDEALMAALNVL